MKSIKALIVAVSCISSLNAPAAHTTADYDFPATDATYEEIVKNIDFGKVYYSHSTGIAMLFAKGNAITTAEKDAAVASAKATTPAEIAAAIKAAGEKSTQKILYYCSKPFSIAGNAKGDIPVDANGDLADEVLNKATATFSTRWVCESIDNSNNLFDMKTINAANPSAQGVERLVGMRALVYKTTKDNSSIVGGVSANPAIAGVSIGLSSYAFAFQLVLEKGTGAVRGLLVNAPQATGFHLLDQTFNIKNYSQGKGLELLDQTAVLP